MEAHDAQPTTLESAESLEAVVQWIDESMAILQNTRDVLRLSRPTRAKKHALRQHLAGVSAAVERIRWALK